MLTVSDLEKDMKWKIKIILANLDLTSIVVWIIKGNTILYYIATASLQTVQFGYTDKTVLPFSL